jgi:hypothetical protein
LFQSFNDVRRRLAVRRLGRRRQGCIVAWELVGNFAEGLDGIPVWARSGIFAREPEIEKRNVFVKKRFNI